MIIHQTASIVAVATRNSDNPKTGNMVQIWILDARMHPAESRATGADSQNQCEGCPLASNNGCYVGINPLGAIWRKLQRGGYETLEMGSPEWDAFFRGSDVRFGAYGNPSALPLEMVADIVRLARRHTGYFHDWALMAPVLAKSYGRFFMASAEPSTREFAENLGLRTFTVSASRPEGSIECLSDTKGLTCSECGLCDGTARSRSRSKPLPSVWIRPHGYQATKADRATATLATA